MMRSLFFSFFLTIWACCSFATTTPTERFLSTYDSVEILAELNELYDHKVTDSFPFLSQVVSNEQEQIFFGYHASSHDFRLFQDILRALFEEVLDLPIPEDFQFMRIPGIPLYNYERGKDSFIDKYNDRFDDLDEEFKKKSIENLFITPFNAYWNCQLRYEDLGSELKEEIFSEIKSFTKDFFRVLYSVEANPLNKSRSMIPRERIDLFNKKLMDFDFSSLAIRSAWHKQQFITLISHVYANLYAKEETLFVKKISSPHLVNSLLLLCGALNGRDSSELEDFLIKHFNHANLLNTLFSINQGDGTFMMELFSSSIWDHAPEQQASLISMNVPLFANYLSLGESTINVFFSNNTIGGGEKHAKGALEAFFLQLGIDPIHVTRLFQLGKEALGDVNAGCLFQFFVRADRKEPAFETLNQNTYASYPYGIPVKKMQASDLLSENPLIPLGKAHALQLRLVINNYTTLNPYGPFRIVRYDLLDEGVAKDVMESLRTYFKGVYAEPAAKKLMREKLLLLWLRDESI